MTDKEFYERWNSYDNPSRMFVTMDLTKPGMKKFYEDEVYINMCACPEIQEQLKIGNGDLVAIKRGTINIDREKGDIEKQEFPKPLIATVWGGSFNYGLNWTAGGNGFKYIIFREDVIVLPQQGQLQDMICFKEYKCQFNGIKLKLLYELVADNYSQMLKWSMEQLWLAFVMKEKYSKIWLNGEWIEDRKLK